MASSKGIENVPSEVVLTADEGYTLSDGNVSGLFLAVTRADEAAPPEKDTAASDTTSLMSSVLKYRHENGRTYHAYKDGCGFSGP